MFSSNFCSKAIWLLVGRGRLVTPGAVELPFEDAVVADPLGPGVPADGVPALEGVAGVPGLESTAK